MQAGLDTYHLRRSLKKSDQRSVRLAPFEPLATSDHFTRWKIAQEGEKVARQRRVAESMIRRFQAL